ncbi:MAG: six-cysteine ranthipeptide SCIFF [Oscillospiraceae bacterium]|nr:six-cysteine ranthipeptide SCIFF [Oscillospiraceae bacterium]
MKHIKTLNRTVLRENSSKSDCSRCTGACRPACRNSCTVTAQKNSEKKQHV